MQVSPVALSLSRVLRMVILDSERHMEYEFCTFAFDVTDLCCIAV